MQIGWYIHFLEYFRLISLVKILNIYSRLFQFGNHDQRRLASRYNPSRVDVFNILSKTLPRVARNNHHKSKNEMYETRMQLIVTKTQGEEIGLTDVWISE